jgi:hypothetical protein
VLCSYLLLAFSYLLRINFAWGSGYGSVVLERIWSSMNVIVCFVGGYISLFAIVLVKWFVIVSDSSLLETDSLLKPYGVGKTLRATYHRECCLTIHAK